jgi:hypothetical protein
MKNSSGVGVAFRFSSFMIGFAALAGLGCGTDAMMPPGVDVTGTWQGSAMGTQIHPFTMGVTQNGSDVAGDGFFDTTAVHVTGTISGKVWSGQLLDTGKGFGTYRLTVEGNTAMGSGTAAGSTVTFTLTR